MEELTPLEFLRKYYLPGSSTEQEVKEIHTFSGEFLLFAMHKYAEYKLGKLCDFLDLDHNYGKDEKK